MITYIHGDLFNSECQYICHQVNCQGKMNSGVAKAIREKWPEVYEEYYKKCEEIINSLFPTSKLLGEAQIITLKDEYLENDILQKVVNLFAQNYYGYDGRQYTSYDAFWNCLNILKNNTPPNSSYAFPYKIGCVRGGASWRVIRTIINEVLGDREVHIYYLDKNVLEPNDRLNLEG